MVDVADIGGKWCISQFAGNIGTLLAINPGSYGIVPSEFVNEFIGEIDLGTLKNQMEGSMERRIFLLETGLKFYSDEEINALLLEEIINSDIDTWHFIVLEPDKAIEGSIFMQVTQTDLAGFPFFLEIGFGSKLYRLETTDKNVALQYMIAYFQEHVIPDISLWEDISG
jgi:hypothetical protein